MQLPYPPSRTDDTTDELAGVRFGDPYRWLERSSPEVADWDRAQGALAAGHVREWPHFPQLRELVAQYTGPRFGSVPRFAGGRWFRTDTEEGSSQARVLMSADPLGDGHVVFDPKRENPDKPPYVSWFSPSPDGTILAIGLCADGSEQNTIRLLDIATGTTLPGAPTQVLMDNWSGGVSWLADSSGFFFSAIDGRAVDFSQQVYLHRRSPEPTTEVVAVPWTAATEYRMVQVGAAGSHAVAVEGLTSPLPVAVAALDEGSPPVWRPFITDIDGMVAGVVVGDALIGVTDVDAPRGRVVSVPLASQTPNDPGSWTELVEQSDAVIRTVTVVGDQLFIGEFVDTYARVRIVSRSGDPAGEVPLPGRGAIAELPFAFMTLVPRGHPERYLFGFSTLTSSWGIYEYRPDSRTVVPLQEPAAVVTDAVICDRWAESADGTLIPYHVVRRRDLDDPGPHPTLIYGYGGFNAPWVPQFPGPMAAFVAAGGTFVHAHLRGGGELGLDWWRDGRLLNKQNGYDDLYAIAEHLVAEGEASPETLAVTGSSGGGLLSGVAVTQRPDLWAVAVPRVPLLDIVGACRDAYGRMCTANEFGDPTDPQQVRRLATFSPYQLIEHGVRYPAVFLDAGATDPRCPPWHARKFAARLQSATSGDGPVLIRVWSDVGHGWATDDETTIEQHTEWLAFVMRHLGMRPG